MDGILQKTTTRATKSMMVIGVKRVCKGHAFIYVILPPFPLSYLLTVCGEPKVNPRHPEGASPLVNHQIWKRRAESLSIGTGVYINNTIHLIIFISNPDGSTIASTTMIILGKEVRFSPHSSFTVSYSVRSITLIREEVGTHISSIAFIKS